MTKIRVAYLLKKFPRLSETFVLGEILGQEAEGADVHIFSRRAPDDELRHPELASLRATVEVLPPPRGLASWSELFSENSADVRGWERFGRLIRDLSGVEYPKLPTLLAEALHVLRRTRELGIDHLHAHFATDSAIVAMIQHRLGGPAYSVTAHAKDIYRSTVDVDLLKHIVEHSAFTVTVCDANLRFIRERLPRSCGDRLRRLYNGIDLDSFEFVPEGTRGVTREANHILAVGRLVEKKGLDVLIEALAILAERGQEFRATLVGEGDARASLEALVTDRRLTDRVCFTGAMDQAGVRRVMREASVFCLPCVIGQDGNRDALPTVLLEAQAVGLPFVSTPVTGIPEIAGDGAGLIVPERDATATADALMDLLGDRDRRCSLAQRGRTHCEALFDQRSARRTLSEWFAESLAVSRAPTEGEELPEQRLHAS